MECESDIEMSEAQNQSEDVGIQTQNTGGESNVWGHLVKSENQFFPNCDLTSDKFVLRRAASCYYKDEFAPQKMKKMVMAVSRKHFKITKDLSQFDGPAFIEDLSRYGTYINGEKIYRNTKRILINGDKISVVEPNFEVFCYRQKNQPSLNDSLEQNENMSDDEDDKVDNDNVEDYDDDDDDDEDYDDDNDEDYDDDSDDTLVQMMSSLHP